MTAPQQHTVLLSRGQRKALAELLPKLTDRLMLEEKNPRKIPFTVDELKTIQQHARDALPDATNGIERNFLRHILHETGKAIEGSQGIGSIPAPERLYQFKIDGERYGDPEIFDDGFDDDDYDCIDSRQTKISEIVPKSGKRFWFIYEYDLGDCWLHEVLFEGCLAAEKGQRYPICVEGERACPPEDVGGIGGYFEFLEGLADPEHERHDEFVRWAGRFDPEKFDAGKRTKVMQRGLPDWRMM